MGKVRCERVPPTLAPMDKNKLKRARSTPGTPKNTPAKKKKRSKLGNDSDEEPGENREEDEATTILKLRFQHKAMFNRIHQKNRELRELETERCFLQLRHDKHAKALALVHRQWASLVEDMSNYLQDIDVSHPAKDTVDLPGLTARTARSADGDSSDSVVAVTGESGFCSNESTKGQPDGPDTSDNKAGDHSADVAENEGEDDLTAVAHPFLQLFIRRDMKIRGGVGGSKQMEDADEEEDDLLDEYDRLALGLTSKKETENGMAIATADLALTPSTDTNTTLNPSPTPPTPPTPITPNPPSSPNVKQEEVKKEDIVALNRTLSDGGRVLGRRGSFNASAGESFKEQSQMMDVLLSTVESSLPQYAHQTLQLLQSLAESLNRRRTEMLASVKLQSLRGDAQSGKCMKELQSVKDTLAAERCVHKLDRMQLARLRQEKASWLEQKNSLLDQLHEKKFEINKVLRKVRMLGGEGSLEVGIQESKAGAGVKRVGSDEWKLIAEGRQKELDSLRDASVAMEVKVNEMKAQELRMSVEINQLQRQCQAMRQDLQSKAQTIDKYKHELEMVKDAREVDKRKFAESETQRLEIFRARNNELQDKLDEDMKQVAALEKIKETLEAKLVDSVSPEIDEDRTLLNQDFQAILKGLETKVQTLREENEVLLKGGDLTDREKRVRHVLFRQHLEQHQKWERRENELTKQIEVLSEFKTEDDLKDANAEGELCSARKENEQLKKKIEELEAVETGEDGVEEKLQEQKTMSEELMAALDDLAKSYEEMQEQNQRLVVQNKKQEKTNVKLASERIKTAKLQALSRKEKAAIVLKLSLCNEKNNKQEEFLRQAESRNKTHLEKQAKCEEMLQINQTRVEALQEEKREKTISQEKIKDECEKTKKLLKEMTKKYDQELRNTDVQNRKIQSLKESLAVVKLKRKADKEKAQTPTPKEERNTISVGLEAELKVLKQRLVCSVCSDRNKSVIITKCFHLFCAECIEQNLKVRLRKCPGCGLGFDKKDVQPVFLT